MVPDGLTSGSGPLSVTEFLCPGPLEQLGKLHSIWVSLWRCPTGALPLPRVAPAFPSFPFKKFHPGGLVVFHATTGNT